jgi:hypothetical protein
MRRTGGDIRPVNAAGVNLPERTVVDRVHPDRAGVGPVPAFTGDDGGDLSVRPGEVEEGGAHRLRAILVPRDHRAAVPAVAEDQAQGVVALLQQRRDVIRRVEHPAPVIGPAGHEAVLGDRPAVEPRLDEAHRADVEASANRPWLDLESDAEMPGRGRLEALEGPAVADPLGGPAVPDQARPEAARFAPVAGLAVVVPHAHLPGIGAARSDRQARHHHPL